MLFPSGQTESDTATNFGILTAKCASCLITGRTTARIVSSHTLSCTHECRGKYWTGLRSACEPMFHTSSLASFAPLMNAAARKLVHRCLTAPVVDLNDDNTSKPKAASAFSGASGEGLVI